MLGAEVGQTPQLYLSLLLLRLFTQNSEQTQSCFRAAFTQLCKDALL